MADEATRLQIKLSATLIERAKSERDALVRQIEESQKTIERSRKIIAQINEVLAQSK